MRRRAHFQAAVMDSFDDNINLTPLLDVLFVILTLFIILAPLLQIDSIELSPKGGGKSHEYAQNKNGLPLQISIDAKGALFLNNKAITLQNLRLVLEKMRSAYPKTTPELFPDKHSPFMAYQQVKSLMEDIGYDQLDIVLKSEAP